MGKGRHSKRGHHDRGQFAERKPHKSSAPKTQRPVRSRISLALGILLILIGLGIVGYLVSGYARNRSDNTDIQKTFKLDSMNPDSSQRAVTQELLKRIDFARLQKINSDIVGWVYVPNTHINYPILKAADNEFYLKHNYKKEAANCGAIFMNASEKMADSSHWLFGHHMRDNTMFADIARYTSKEYAQSHSKAYIVLNMEQGATAYVLKFDRTQSLKGNANLPTLKPGEWGLATCGYSFKDQRIAAYFHVVDVIKP